MANTTDTGPAVRACRTTPTVRVTNGTTDSGRAAWHTNGARWQFASVTYRRRACVDLPADPDAR